MLLPHSEANHSTPSSASPLKTVPTHPLPHSETNNSTLSSASLHKTVTTHPLPHSETNHNTLPSASGWHDGNVKSTKTASNVLLRWNFGFRNTYRAVFVLLTRFWKRHVVKSSYRDRFVDLTEDIPAKSSPRNKNVDFNTPTPHSEANHSASSSASPHKTVPTHPHPLFNSEANHNASSSASSHKTYPTHPLFNSEANHSAFSYASLHKIQSQGRFPDSEAYHSTLSSASRKLSRIP